MNEEQKKNQRRIDLTVGDPLHVMVQFAIPMLIGQLFHLLYTIVDTRMVGEILGESSLAAVGATTTVADMLIGFVNGVTNGFAIVVARYFGAKDEKGIRKTHANASIYSIGICLFLSAVTVVFLQPILTFLHVSTGLRKEAGLYLGIMAMGLLASGLYNMGAASLRAIGDAYMPLVFLVFSSVLNIGLDYYFMSILQKGVAGAAVATVIAQAVAAICCIVYSRWKYSVLCFKGADIVPDKELTKQLFSTGLGMGLMVSFVQLGTVVLQTAINSFEEATIVAHTAARKLTSLFMLPFSVGGSAFATYCGQNIGAKKYNRIRAGLIRILAVVWSWSGFVFVINLLFAPKFVYWVTGISSDAVMQTAAMYLRFDTAFYFITAVITSFRNCMQGYGDNKTPVFSSCLELIGKILIALFLAPKVGYWGIIVAEPIVWFIMVIPLIVNLLRSDMWKLSKSV